MKIFAKSKIAIIYSLFMALLVKFIVWRLKTLFSYSEASIFQPSNLTLPLLTIAGAFQSDALLVPEHCLFDHIHNQTKCWDFDQWNRTAASACQERSMKVKSFAMLLPCGIDVFSGVEFVCCPMTKKGVNVCFRCTVISYKHKPKIVFVLFLSQGHTWQTDPFTKIANLKSHKIFVGQAPFFSF